MCTRSNLFRSFAAEVQRYVSKRNIMASLGELIETDSDVLLNTSKALVDLLKNNVEMQESFCRNRDVVAKIVTLLDSADKNVQLNCITVITILGRTEEGRIALTECDAKRHLIALTHSSSTEIKQLSTDCIKLLSQEDDME
jgi:hypothetical protein